MSDYYAELAGNDDLSRVDGWRHKLEQWLRFEAVVRGLAIEAGDSVVDLGCGTGRLLEYLGTSREGAYIGIDLLESSLERARESLPNGEFVGRDVFGFADAREEPFDFAVAVGTMVDGDCHDRKERLTALSRLMRSLDGLAQKGWALVVLNQQKLQEDPLRRLEGSLQGASKLELASCLEELKVDAVIDDKILPSDLFVIVHRDDESPAVKARIAGEHTHEAVIRRYRQRIDDVDEADLAWLCMVAARYERARELIEKLPATHRRKQLLSERLSMQGH